MDEDAFRLLARGDIEGYRTFVHASRHVRPRLTFDKDWAGRGASPGLGPVTRP
ncbi:hypothetical protein [Streptomyces sp. NPDC057363]|uniref:hypothetical protein n=1 Tax=Streptomyces sp. NPDC057363 TaxID=3346107 RepID=UPI00363E6BE0